MSSTRRMITSSAVVLALVLALVVALVIGMIIFVGGAQQQAEQQASQMCMAAQVSGPVGNGSIAVPAVGRVTSDYGERPNPFGAGILPLGYTSERQLTWHPGVDVGGMAEGSPIYAALPGTVSAVELGGDAKGNGVLVDVGGGVSLLYWHMATGTITVKTGQQVTAGQQLGGAGDTGTATAVHLHLEARVNGQAVDPQQFLAGHGLVLQLDQAPRLTEAAQAAASTSSSPSASSAKPEEGDLPELTAPVVITLPSGTNYTLKDEQVRTASNIIGVGRQLGVSDRGIQIALMTALAESMLMNIASPAVPESLDYPHDLVAQNKDSVNAFQQRHTMGWGSVAELMNPEYAARAFYGGNMGPNGGSPRGLMDVPGWDSMSLGSAAQAVQGSAHPEGYAKWETVSAQLLGQITGTAPAPVQCQGPAVQAGEESAAPSEQGQAADEDTEQLAIPDGVQRADVVASAEKGVGGDYVWGGDQFQAWDASGFVSWAYRDAGIPMPRTAPWSAGTRTETPQPGDLVAQQWDPQRRRWEHVGIYVGDGMMISAINESAGTRRHPVAQTGDDSVYFQILQEQQ